MNISVCCFAARRYWTDEHELNAAFDSIKKELSDLSQSIYLVDDEFNLNYFNEKNDDLLIAIPMSGAVQPRVLNTAKSFGNVLLLAGYINGMFENEERSRHIMEEISINGKRRFELLHFKIL